MNRKPCLARRVAYVANCVFTLLVATVWFAPTLRAQGVPLPDIILDSENTTGIAPHSVTVNGAWTTGTNQAGKHGASFLHDNDTHGVNKWVRYTPSIPAGQGGWYRVSLWSPSAASYGNNVEIQVNTSGGVRNKQLNQRQNGGRWNLIGTFHFNEGTAGNVTIRSTRTDGATVTGYVLADAVRFTKVAPEVVMDSHDTSLLGVTVSGIWTDGAATPAHNGDYKHDGNTGQNGQSTRSIESSRRFPSLEGTRFTRHGWPTLSIPQTRTSISIMQERRSRSPSL